MLEKFKLSLAIGLLFLIASSATAQKQDSLNQFPASWTGTWSGHLQIYSPTGPRPGVDMSLEIFPIDSSTQGRYTFGIIYGDKSKDWRPYELVPVAPEKGLWRVDERNSIVMESYLTGPKLLCWFVVSGNRILCTYEKTDERTMVFEVMSGKEKPVSQTGNSVHEGEEIPEVQTFPFSAFQRAVLTRQ